MRLSRSETVVSAGMVVTAAILYGSVSIGVVKLSDVSAALAFALVGSLFGMGWYGFGPRIVRVLRSKTEPEMRPIGFVQVMERANLATMDNPQKPFQGIKRDAAYDHVEAHLFFPWYFSLGPISRLSGKMKDLNHVPRIKLVVNTKTNRAYWMCDYAQRLLTPIQKIQWVSHRKAFIWSRLDEWCKSNGYMLVRKCATRSELLQIDPHAS